MRRLLAPAALFAAMACSSSAHAQIFDVIAPDVEAGLFSIDLLNGTVLGEVEPGETRTAMEIAFTYGVFDFYSTSLTFDFSKPSGESWQHDVFYWEHLLVLPLGPDDEEATVDYALGLYGNLEVPRSGGLDEGAISVGPTASLTVGPIYMATDLLFWLPFDEEESTGFYYDLEVNTEVAESWSVGIEAHGEIDAAFAGAPALSEQGHYFGPAVGYAAELGPGVYLEPRMALLFGLTEESTDTVLSFNLSVSF